MGIRLNLENQKFGYLTVLRDAGRASSGAVKWMCQCDCGKKKVVASDSLRSGRVYHCGCQGRRALHDLELIGKQFGRLTVRSKQGYEKKSQALWNCVCSCGKEVVVRGGNLVSSNTRSCGCAIAFKHGMSRTSEYMIWSGIKARCFNKNNSAYSYYGGRGITMHDPWINDFMKFFEYVGKRPGPEYSIDRINSDGNYAPGNVRWVTDGEQMINRKARGTTFNYYQNNTKKTAIYPKEDPFVAIVYCALGLSSEAGEIASKIKKCMRDNEGIIDREVKNSLIGEIGDCFWYLSELSSNLGVSLDYAAKKNLSKLMGRKERGTLKGSGDNR